MEKAMKQLSKRQYKLEIILVEAKSSLAKDISIGSNINVIAINLQYNCVYSPSLNSSPP